MITMLFPSQGGILDPGGYSGDLGVDVSLDGGMTWTTRMKFILQLFPVVTTIQMQPVTLTMGYTILQEIPTLKMLILLSLPRPSMAAMLPIHGADTVLDVQRSMTN